jgi:signal transduction histidine kinase/ligand-binding sensor domain-containing protein
MAELRCLPNVTFVGRVFMRAAFAFAALVVGLGGRALALDPSQAVSDYLRTTFTRENGLPSDIINAVLQTQDGFLWVGTASGIARFDGLHFDVVTLSPRKAGLGRALAQSPDGDLWVGSVAGIFRIEREALDQFGELPSTLYHPGLGLSDEITVLHFSREGVLWVGTNQGLFRMDHETFTPVLPKVSVSRIVEARNGNLLLITGEGFVELSAAGRVDHPGLTARLGVASDGIFHVFEDHAGARWYCTVAGVAREMNGSIQRLQPYGTKGGHGAYRAYEDAQGNVWFSLATGLARASATGLERVPETGARSIYSDRDGNVWVGTNGQGLIRFKNRTVRMFTTADGLPSNIVMTVLVSSDGKLWVGNNCGGISWFDGRRFQTYNGKDGLPGCVFGLAEDANKDLWAGTPGGGIFRFHDGRFTRFSTPEGLADVNVRGILSARDGSLWISTRGGLSRMHDGHFRNYTTADGLASDRITSVYQDRDGEIWVGTTGGVDRLEGDRFVTLSTVPDAVAYSVIGEAWPGGLYAYVEPKGTFRVEKNRLVNVITGPPVTSFPVHSKEDLWFAGASIVRTAPDAFDRWEHERDAPLDYTAFGLADGLKSMELSDGFHNIAMTNDGKLWVATTEGLAMIDVPNVRRVNEKPSIYLEKVVVGKTVQTPGHELTVPRGPHHVELHFGVIELTSPERIRFQYRLDDEEWSDADPTATAIYSSFRVGAHKFHVRACNSDGLWDRAGIVYTITQLPFFYETNLFRVAVAGMLALLVAGAYQLRLRRITAQMNARLDERVAERTRLARELHDTLLQTIQASKMVATDAVNDADDPVLTRATLEKLAIWLGKAMQEARASLLALRASTTEANDLAEALRRAGEESVAAYPLQFDLLVEGTAKDMHPIVRDEVYRIGYEAIRNAFIHSGGTKVEVVLSYAHGLELRVRDDGKGIDPDIAAKGKPGHFGLIGMQERATRIAGKLTVRSSADAGTEVELIVPGRIVFAQQRSLWRRFKSF